MGIKGLAKLISDEAPDVRQNDPAFAYRRKAEYVFVYLSL
jgi:hypothetical protein